MVCFVCFEPSDPFQRTVSVAWPLVLSRRLPTWIVPSSVFRQKSKLDYRSVSVFVSEGPAGPARLAGLLRHPQLRSAVWSCGFRADGWPDELLPVLRAAAEEQGFSYEFFDGHMSFARPPGLPEIESPARSGLLTSSKV